jgi:phosphatidylserine decarboxylase
MNEPVLSSSRSEGADDAAVDARFRDRAFAKVQSWLPTRFLSWCMFVVTRIETRWFKDAFIGWFIRRFGIELKEAQLERAESYKSFNDFFTRALKENARPLAFDPDAFVSPVDGTVSELGEIRRDRMVQAKGFDYSLVELLGGDEHIAQPFLNGNFCTIYLAPFNYHRIHMPTAGTLREWIYVPGRLFSVNRGTTLAMPRLFTRNERVVALFETGHGPMALVMVGALFVGSIETVWSGRVTPPHSRGAVATYQLMQPLYFPRGAEVGRFNMGSTVILVTAPGSMQWSPELKPLTALRMGEAIGGPRQS